MRPWRLIVDDGAGAAEGLATDEFLMQAYHADELPPPTLRLYTYRTHCALVGRFQDPAAELDLAACAETGTEVNRRPTGGGAIVMGRQQLGVALVTSLRDPITPTHARAIIDRFAAGVVGGLARLGIDGELRGKNDIAVARRKIAGLGIYVDARDAVLFHSSVLADLDVDFMLRVLNIPAAKLSDKAVASVRERITTATAETGAEVTVDRLRALVAEGYEEAFGVSLEPEPLSGEERAGMMELVAQRYGTPEWVMRRTADAPAGSSILKTPGGLLRISIGLSGDAVKDVLIAGDFMASDGAVAEIEAALRWGAADRARIADRVAEGVRRGGGLEGVAPEDLTEAIWAAVVDARARRGATGSCYYPEHAAVQAEPEEATIVGRTLPIAGGRPAEHQTSPEWVRISMASAIALRFRSGRFTREFPFGGINLLLQYDEGCLSDCSYCGLARTRPGWYEDKSFIRVDWPLVPTDEFVARLAKHEDKLTRLCISMVTHGHAYRDTVDITERIRAAVRTPLSILVAPPTLDRARIEHFREIGVDMIGVGLDAATEELFVQHRTNVPQGGLRWRKYWEVIDDARDVFGAWKVNAHVLVGLGETDRDLCDLFYRLVERQIFPYLFSFNPEPDSRLGAAPRAPLGRWRRIQLLKHLIETQGLQPEQLTFDDDGALVALRAPRGFVLEHVRAGEAFMTNGCPGPNGEPGCTRPYGSYRPSEPFRDFPFLPLIDDTRGIEADLRLDEILT